VSSFSLISPPLERPTSSTTTTTTTRTTTSTTSRILTSSRTSIGQLFSLDRNIRIRCLYNSLNDDNDVDDDDDEDDDDYIDTDSLGDWRNFRRSLFMVQEEGTMAAEGSMTDSTTKQQTAAATASSSSKKKKVNVSNENEELLKSQNAELHQEYKSGVWAHETSTVRGDSDECVFSFLAMTAWIKWFQCRLISDMSCVPSSLSSG